MAEKAQSGYSRIKEAGILVTLPGDLPLDRVTMVADSLLAAPILAGEVAFRGKSSLNVVGDLRNRAGELMVLGMTELETAEQVEDAAAAGAQFISSPRLDAQIQRACVNFQLEYIPTVISVWAAQSAFERGCRMIRLRTGGPQGGAYLQAVREVVPDLEFLLDVIDLQIDDVATYAGLGAAALVTGSAVYQNGEQPMADIITRARVLQQAWLAVDHSKAAQVKPAHQHRNGKGNH